MPKRSLQSGSVFWLSARESSDLIGRYMLSGSAPIGSSPIHSPDIVSATIPRITSNGAGSLRSNRVISPPRFDFPPSVFFSTFWREDQAIILAGRTKILTNRPESTSGRIVILRFSLNRVPIALDSFDFLKTCLALIAARNL